MPQCWRWFCKSLFMNATDILGLAAGILTACSMLPQLVKTVKEKKAEEISLGMLLVLLAGIALWVWYGIKKNDLPIIATNAFSLLINLVMVGLRIKYGKN